MSKEQSTPPDTTTLSTKLEEDFVSPLTAIRGSLEILRDFPDLDSEQRSRFVASALEECGRLERGIRELAASVYAAGRRSQPQAADGPQSMAGPYAARLRIDRENGVVDIDFSDFEFSSTELVNEFFDAIEALVSNTGRRWFFVTNFRNCRVWPEAWVAFAHRGKRVSVVHARGTLRYAEHGDEAGAPGVAERDLYPSRAAAMAEVERMRASGSG
jgi:hypothetical protein